MKHKMLKRTLTAAMLTLAASAAYAQTNVMTAKIPFAFRAVGSDLPAGRYKIVPAAGSTGTMEWRNMDTGKAVFIPSKVPVTESATGSRDARARLIFQCGGEEGCSLATLWSGTGTGVEFGTPPLTASQKERRETIYLDRFKGK
jgi:hypothetical protein